MTSSGSSPLNIIGLEPGEVYTVMINLFDDDQVVITNQTINQIIVVMGDKSGKFYTCVLQYLNTHCAVLHIIMVYVIYLIGFIKCCLPSTQFECSLFTATQ